MGECWRSLDLSCAGTSGIVLTIAALVLYCISIGEETWALGDSDVEDVDMGLFKFCRNRCERYVDNSFLDRPTNLALVSRTRAASGMVVLGVLCCLVTAIMCAFSMGRKGHFVIIRRGAFFQIVAGFWGFVAVCIFGDIIRQLNNDDAFKSYDFKPGGAFVTGTLAFICNIIAAIMLLIDSKNIVYMPVDAVTRGGGGMI